MKFLALFVATALSHPLFGRYMDSGAEPSYMNQYWDPVWGRYLSSGPEPSYHHSAPSYMNQYWDPVWGRY
jgi:hypothetical protein